MSNTVDRQALVTNLPPEILHHVFANLNRIDHVLLALSCHSMYETVLKYNQQTRLADVVPKKVTEVLALGPGLKGSRDFSILHDSELFRLMKRLLIVPHQMHVCDRCEERHWVRENKERVELEHEAHLRALTVEQRAMGLMLNMGNGRQSGLRHVQDGQRD